MNILLYGRIRQMVALGLLLLLPLATGCVSAKYKKAGPDTPPPLPLNLAVAEPAVAATVHTVIVYKGPGSWKKSAYWDEYIVTISNPGPDPLTVDSVLLTDAVGVDRTTGSDPWELEKLSRENLKAYEQYGRKVLLGAGVTAGWVASGALTVGAAYAGAGALAVVGAATFVALPVWALSSGIRTINARSAIQKEFQQRRVLLPLALAPGANKQGSLFFPVSPGPQRMILRYHTGANPGQATLELTPLAGLHLLKQLTGPAVPAPKP